MAVLATQIQPPSASPAIATGCPACGERSLRPFYTVRDVPVHSCLQMPDRASALAHPRADLALAFCDACGFVTNVAFQPERLDYSAAYEETQGASPTFNAFARALAGEWIQRYELRGRRIVEIGCGKGEFLALICGMGDNDGIGFDPAYVPGREGAAANGRVRFVREFYSDRHRDTPGDFFCCRHTLEHIGPVADFVTMLRRNLEGRPAVVGFEVPDLERILEETAFWDLYYEHCSYFTLTTLCDLFRRCGFRIQRSRRVYGDQYLVIDALPNGPSRASERPESLELLRGQVERFARQAGRRIEEWRGRIDQWRAEGRHVVLWGSGSKAVGFLATLGIEDEIEAVVDINPHKHGKFMPGCRQEIVAPERLLELRPDVVIVMNAIYREEIGHELEAMKVEAQLLTLQ